MTIIIGAELSDGRRLITGDGNIITTAGGVVANKFVKVRKVQSTYKNRTALVGVAGTPVDIIPVCNAVTSFMNSPATQLEDLHHRLCTEFARMGQCNYSAIVWLPVEDREKNVEYHLVSICDAHYPRVSEHKFVARGSGGVEASAALLGLQYRDFDKMLPEEQAQGWRPSERDVDLAYSVACSLDAFCGGDRTTIFL